MKFPKIVASALILVIALTMLAACGAPAPAAQAPAATDAPKPVAAAPTEAPKPAAASAGGTLVGGFDVGPAGVAQVRPYNHTGGNTWLMKIWSPLLSYNDTLTGLEPQLASKWSSNADATKWTFTIRPEAKWNDGQPVTADDVKFTFELILNPAFGWKYDLGVARELVGADGFSKGNAKEVTGIKVVDPQNVEFALTTPDYTFTYKMVNNYILPAHVLKSQDPAKLAKSDWFMTEPVGTGPFKVAKYVKDQYQDLVPNKYYWRGTPKLGHLINRYFTDEAAAAVALEKGEIQFTYVGPDVALRLKQNSSFQISQFSSGTTQHIMFNLRDPRWSDVRVRQAFAYAIDRNAILKDVFKGTAVPLYCNLSVNTFWPSDLNKYEYNPEKAKQLLADAKWNSSEPIEMEFYYTDQVQKDAAQAMQDYLNQVGLNVTAKLIDGNLWNKQWASGAGWSIIYRGQGLMFGRSSRNYMMPVSSTNDKKSLAGLDDAELNKRVVAAEQATTNQDYVAKMQDVCRYMNQQVIDVPMWVPLRFGAYSSKLKDFYWIAAAEGGPYEDHAEKWDIVP